MIKDWEHGDDNWIVKFRLAPAHDETDTTTATTKPLIMDCATYNRTVVSQGRWFFMRSAAKIFDIAHYCEIEEGWAGDRVYYLVLYGEG